MTAGGAEGLRWWLPPSGILKWNKLISTISQEKLHGFISLEIANLAFLKLYNYSDIDLPSGAEPLSSWCSDLVGDDIDSDDGVWTVGTSARNCDILA